MSHPLCWFFAIAASSCVSAAIGSETPAPGRNTFIITSPMTSAIVVASSNQRIAFSPMRPMAFRSPLPAMPTTSVENSSGAMIILIMRRNMSARGLIADADGGPEIADHDAREQADEDLGRQRWTT